MNFHYFIVASLFILGYASAKAFQQESEQSSIEHGDNNLSGKQSPPGQQQESNGPNSFVLDGNEKAGASTTPIALLDTATEIRQYVVSKLREIYSMLQGCKNKVDVQQATRLNFQHLPRFRDPLYVGNFTKTYILSVVTFSNVYVYGMRNFHDPKVDIEREARSVDLRLLAPDLIIRGNYFLSNFFTETWGPFVVKLVDVTYHESSVYCHLKNEVDIAVSHCGIRYGKSENDYANIGLIMQQFRGVYSQPMIDEVLQSVGRKIGHKMRPVLLSKLRETVMGQINVRGLETLIRGAVSEARNLMMRGEYKNFQLDGVVDKMQYGTHDGSIKFIFLSGINAFEITKLEIPILKDRIVVHVTVHDTNVNGTATIDFVENDVIQVRVDDPTTVVALPFDVDDLAVDITFEKLLSSDEERFVISQLNVTVSKITTHPPPDATYPSQIAVGLRDFLPHQLQSVITERFATLARSQIENILREAY